MISKSFFLRLIDCCSLGKKSHILCYTGFIMTVKPVSHQPCGSRAPICDDKFLGFVRQPHSVVTQHRKTAVQKTRSQGCRNEFSTCSFSLRFVCVFEKTYNSRKKHKAATRLLQGVHTTDVIVCQPCICLMTAARLPQGKRALYPKVATRMP